MMKIMVLNWKKGELKTPTAKNTRRTNRYSRIARLIKIKAMPAPPNR